jgi:hypothetical protein
LILTLIRSQEKLQQRRVSDEPTIFAFHIWAKLLHFIDFLLQSHHIYT